MTFNKDVLKMDCENEIEKICKFIKLQTKSLKRDGVVLGLSGGVDSALIASLCVKALGKEEVLGLLLPEKESNKISAEFAKKQAEKIGLDTITVDITPVLEAFGTYAKRDKTIQSILPEYDNHCKSKIVLPQDLLSKDAYNFFTLKIVDQNDNVTKARLDNRSLRSIVAATNTKHITRMMHLYYYADLNNYLVCGTTNRTEMMQGFFVKYGDGGVDTEPIAHLYKTQVYQLAQHLGVIHEIMERAPSPDTFSFEITDEEMYFRMPYSKLDLLLFAWENNIAVSEVQEVMGLTEDQVNRAFRDISSKYRTTKYLREPVSKL